MFEAVQHVVLVDNGSDDGTAEVAARGRGARRRRRPVHARRRTRHQVSRAGEEHLHTPPDSLHSLTYFYNWSFSHVRTAYSMKWDGDMVLTREGVELLRDLSWQLRGSGAVVAIPRHPMTVESESVAWLDLGYRFLEPWVYPMGPEFTFVKAFEWEVREFPRDLRADRRPRGHVRGAEVARPGRVRALEHHRLRRRPHAAQGARARGLPGPVGGSRRVEIEGLDAGRGARRACTSSTT